MFLISLVAVASLGVIAGGAFWTAQAMYRITDGKKEAVFTKLCVCPKSPLPSKYDLTAPIGFINVNPTGIATVINALGKDSELTPTQVDNMVQSVVNTISALPSAQMSLDPALTATVSDDTAGAFDDVFSVAYSLMDLAVYSCPKENCATLSASSTSD